MRPCTQHTHPHRIRDGTRNVTRGPGVAPCEYDHPLSLWVRIRRSPCNRDGDSSSTLQRPRRIVSRVLFSPPDRLAFLFSIARLL